MSEIFSCEAYYKTNGYGFCLFLTAAVSQHYHNQCREWVSEITKHFSEKKAKETLERKCTFIL